MPPAPGAAGQASGAMRAASSAVESSLTTLSSQTGARWSRSPLTGARLRSSTSTARRATLEARPTGGICETSSHPLGLGRPPLPALAPQDPAQGSDL
jgi:hypothetical protein